jgi:hypothetical protein
MSKLMHGANVQIFGDPTTMAGMMQGFMRATGYGLPGDGLLRSLGPEARELLSKLGLGLGEHLGVVSGNGNGAAPPAAAMPPAAAETETAKAESPVASALPPGEG